MQLKVNKKIIVEEANLLPKKAFNTQLVKPSKKRNIIQNGLRIKKDIDNKAGFSSDEREAIANTQDNIIKKHTRAFTTVPGKNKILNEANI